MFFNRTKNVQLWRYCNLFHVNRFDVDLVVRDYISVINK
jgi:hypothetical protein